MARTRVGLDSCCSRVCGRSILGFGGSGGVRSGGSADSACPLEAPPTRQLKSAGLGREMVLEEASRSSQARQLYIVPSANMPSQVPRKYRLKLPAPSYS